MQEINEENQNNENDILESDEYLLELQKQLVEMRKERKKAQLEQELLQNRVRLLKSEEGKVKHNYQFLILILLVLEKSRKHM